MALVKATLEQQILSLLNDLSNQQDNPAQARQQFASQLATMIDAYIKTGTVNVTVATTGSAAAQTGTGVGTIS